MAYSITIYKRVGKPGVYARVCTGATSCDKRAIHGANPEKARDNALVRIIGPAMVEKFKTSPKAKIAITVRGEGDVHIDPMVFTYVRGQDGDAKLASSQPAKATKGGDAEKYARARFAELRDGNYCTASAMSQAAKEVKSLFGAVPKIPGITVAAEPKGAKATGKGGKAPKTGKATGKAPKTGSKATGKAPKTGSKATSTRASA